MIVGEVAALVLVSVAALKHDDRDAQHQRSQPEDDAHLDSDGNHVAVDPQPEAVDDRARSLPPN
jgi:hypothetical protein